MSSNSSGFSSWHSVSLQQKKENKEWTLLNSLTIVQQRIENERYFCIEQLNITVNTAF